MKVLILYATYGGGYLSAAKAIEEAINKNYPNYKVKMVDFMQSINKVINNLTVKAYSDMAKKMPKAWGLVYRASRKGPVAEISKLSNKLLVRKMLSIIKTEKPDVIISTHPFSSQMCATLKKHGKINVSLNNILTDFKYHEQWLIKHQYADKFFVSNEKMKEDLISYGISEKKIYVTGIPISQRFLKKYNKEEVLKQFNLKNNLKTIILFAGGKLGLARKNIFMYLEEICKIANNFQIVAISGKNQKIYNKFLEIAEKSNNKENIKIIEYTDKVPELMSISDLVITKPGGITASESLASHVPMLVINPIPGQETENAEFLEENNLALWVRKDEDILEILKNITNEITLEKLKENTKRFSKANAANEICKIIFEKNN